MTFGQRIKSLRLKANMTQEGLAALLSISPQAISRWETNANMPDISLLPPLANLFNVTTDYLLGIDSYQKDLRKAAFDEAYHEYWRQDDKEKNYQIALRAVSEYPGNMKYLEWLGSAEYYVSVSSDGDRRKRLLESSVKHYGIVLGKQTERDIHDRALQGIVFSLRLLGKYDKAKEYAMKQADEDKRNELLLWCLDGEEKVRHGQMVAEKLLNRLCTYLSFAGKTIERCNATENILEILFSDGNYQYYHNILQYNCIDKAAALCRNKRYDEAIAELRKARAHAEKMVKYSKQNHFAFTAPLFCYVTGDKKPTDSHASDVDDFVKSLNNNSCFDPIRQREDFSALLFL